MTLKSNFNADLKKEQQLALLLDTCYKTHLKEYTFERIRDKNRQFKGIDLIFTHNKTGVPYLIDEKAQLDYINDDLPTFAFELSYTKDKRVKKGWFFDPDKQTAFYALITAIYADAPNIFTSCKITFVNRKKLIMFLSAKGINEAVLTSYVDADKNVHGKITLKELNHNTEGYLFVSRKNKAEQPVNLILRLAFLIENGLSKRLV